jgi:cellulose synthase/poly-beta-1,6-N-acetylglucosamine synthase-like glycosyltransferase
VPFRAGDPDRDAAWAWLQEYWRAYLPEAQIVIGEDDGEPFSRAAALNDAFRRSDGYYLVVVDADCYLPVDVVRSCTRAIQDSGKALWFVPWKRRVNLTAQVTAGILASESIPRFPTEPDALHEIAIDVHTSPAGIASIMSRRAWERAMGHDSRFSGWGGEDRAFFAAVDTMYGPHTRTDNDVYHLYHPLQRQPKHRFQELLSQYTRATGDRDRMLNLLEGREAAGVA